MKIKKLFLLAAAPALLIAYDAGAQEESTVVGICIVCHGVDGTAPDFKDVPIIAGTPATHIEEAIYSYQDGARRCIDEPAMCEAVFRLSEDEVAEAADYFANKKRVMSGEAFSDLPFPARRGSCRGRAGNSAARAALFVLEVRDRVLFQRQPGYPDTGDGGENAPAHPGRHRGADQLLRQLQSLGRLLLLPTQQPRDEQKRATDESERDEQGGGLAVGEILRE